MLSAYSYTGAGYDPRYASLEAQLGAAPEINVPTLIVQGADDPLERPGLTRAVDERLFTGGLTRIVLEGVGHWPQRESPADIADLLP